MGAAPGKVRGRTFRIRPARIEDSAGLAQVQVDSYCATYGPILPPAYMDHFSYEEQRQDWRDILSTEMADVLYVAESTPSWSSGPRGRAHHRILGYALGRAGATAFAPYDGELVAIHVLPGVQRQGIGRLLLVAIARELRQQGATSLMLWALKDNPSRGFYERLGAQLLAEREWDGNEHFGVSVQEVAYGWADILALTLATHRPLRRAQR